MADYTYVTSNGVIVPDTGDILTDVQNEYKDVFGSDLIVTPDTPQGMLINAEALARVAVVNNNADLANQINPNLAGGVFLDAIMAFTGIARTLATRSTVTATVTGVQGTLIPAGSQARETTNNALFETVTDVTIPIGGSTTVQFQSVDTGAIPATAGTLTQIVSGVLGWETVSNAASATLGSDTQSDIEARQYRRNTLAAQGSSLAEAISSAIYQVPGVQSLTFLENPTSSPAVVEGVSMGAHSLYTCVNGGTDLLVAQAIMSKKSGGCAMNNGASASPVTQAVTIPFSGQSIDVLFDRPDVKDVLCVITVIVEDSTITDPEQTVKDAIVNYANGQNNGESGFVVGQDVSSFELAGAVNIAAPGIYVKNCVIAFAPTVPSTLTELTIEPWELAQITSGDITVTVTT